MNDQLLDIESLGGPQLDALLRRTLAAATADPRQRQRHLARLAASQPRPQEPLQAARMGGMQRVSPARIRVPSPPAPPPAAHRRRRDALELAGAALALALVAALLVAVFRGDGNHRAAAPLATPAATPPASPAATPAVTTSFQHRLVVVTTDSVSALDLPGGGTLYTLDGLLEPDATLSPDGTRLYIAGLTGSDDGDNVAAFDAATGREVWRVPLADRIRWIVGIGPSTLAVSGDGRRLFVLDSAYRIQVFDTATGQHLPGPETTLGDCPAMFYPSADGRTLYVACLRGRSLRVLDLESMTFGDALVVGGSIVGGALSPDGGRLYVVSDNPDAYRVAVIDTRQRALLREVELGHAEHPNELRQLVAVSGDGRRLLVGIDGDGGDGDLNTQDVREVAVFDTATWGEAARLTAGDPLAGQTLAANYDGSSFYVAGVGGYSNQSFGYHLSRVDVADGASVGLASEGSEIIRLVAGPLGPTTAAPPAGAAPGALLLVDEQAEGRFPHNTRARPVDPLSLADLPGYLPRDFGHHFITAVSPDGRTLAAITWPSGSNNEGGRLRLFDLSTWQETPTSVEFDEDASGLTFTPDGLALLWSLPTGRSPAHGVPLAYEIERYDLATQTLTTAARLPETIRPAGMRPIDGGARLALYGIPTDENNLATDAPHVLIVDLGSGAIDADIRLDGVRAGQYQTPTAAGVDYTVYLPGLAWDDGRQLLYVAHADEERVTVVDLAAGRVREQRDIRRSTSLLDRLMDWLVPGAAAKGGEYVSRAALLSPDGSRLYVSAGDGLRVVDTGDFTETARVSALVGGWLLSADGRRLLVQQHDEDIGPDAQLITSNQRLVLYDADGLRPLGQLDLDVAAALYGISADGRYAWISRQRFAGEVPSIEVSTIDLDTMTVAGTRERDDAWFGQVIVVQR